MPGEQRVAELRLGQIDAAPTGGHKFFLHSASFHAADDRRRRAPAVTHLDPTMPAVLDELGDVGRALAIVSRRDWRRQRKSTLPAMRDKQLPQPAARHDLGKTVLHLGRGTECKEHEGEWRRLRLSTHVEEAHAPLKQIDVGDGLQGLVEE